MELKIVKSHFMSLNRARLQRTKDSLRGHSRQFLDILPLLFHVNHPLLPGFVSKDTPSGVAEYTPEKSAIKYARVLAKSFFYKKRALYTYDITAIYIMGSSGTIAYSEASDMDVWVCYRNELNQVRLQELQQKMSLIETWALSHGVEVHFHLMNPEIFKSGEHRLLSTESSGSALHDLLLDEFYRTGLIIAGRYPLWWLVPPEKEQEYEDYAAYLIKRGFVREHEFLDFGGISRIPPEEFFGASLWQLFKGIDSPYKSALKILLMEAYASEYPQVDLLSLRYKKAIYGGELLLDFLDPYVMLYKKVEEYLENLQDHNRLTLIRRCFYFKVDEHLSRPAVAKTGWRREMMIQLVKNWGWTQAQMLILDTHKDWKIEKLLEERKILIDLLTNSYQFLSNFVRKHAHLSLINQQDLNILGRKLYAAFERKAGKVEVVSWSELPRLKEQRITLMELVQEEGFDHWALYRDAVNYEEIGDRTPIRRGHTLVELFAWAYFNGIIDRDTQIYLQLKHTDVHMREARGVLETYRRQFPLELLKNIPMSAYAATPQILAAVIFANLGVAPLQNLASQGKYLISSHTNPLSYGGQGENLVVTMDLVLLTSWREVYSYKYTGIEGIMQCLCYYIRWGRLTEGIAPPNPVTNSYATAYGLMVAKRVAQFFSDVILCFFGTDQGKNNRYLVGVEQGFFLFYLDNGIPQYQHSLSFEKLMDYLEKPLKSCSTLIFDQQTLQDTPLPLIAQLNKAGVIQVYFYHDEIHHHTEIYVMDEMGSLFRHKADVVSFEQILQQYAHFFELLMRRRNILIHGPQGGLRFERVEYQRLYKKAGHYQAIPLVLPALNQARSRSYPLQVMVDQIDNQPAYKIYCDQKEFSTSQYGDHLFNEVLDYLRQRDVALDKQAYFVGDVDISAAFYHRQQQGTLQSVQYLRFKHDIEEKINGLKNRRH